MVYYGLDLSLSKLSIAQSSRKFCERDNHNAVILKSSNTIVLALVAQNLHDETKQHIHVVSVQPKVQPINKCTFILKD